MRNSNYMAKQRAMYQGLLDVGEQLGMQKMWDYVQIVLHNPAIMGKDTFGACRLDIIFQELKVMADEYHTAFTTDKEADYYQELMDRQLRDIWGDKTLPFYERYPELKKVRYDKAMKGWK